MKMYLYFLTLVYLVTAQETTMKVEYKYKKNQGWSLLSHSSSRAYLHIIGHRTWIQAEDTCQSLYGHLARDDPGGVLREFINANELTGQVWVGLHQPSPNEPFRWVDEFSWISDWAPGRDAVEGEEQYQQSLCVALNVDQDYRWDTRFCEGEKVSSAICQIEVPAWLRHAGQCELGRDWVKDSSLLYYPDNETLRCECGEETHIVCTIEDPVNHEVDSCCFYKNKDKDVDAIFEQLFEPENGLTTTAALVSSKPTWLNNANASKNMHSASMRMDRNPKSPQGETVENVVNVLRKKTVSSTTTLGSSSSPYSTRNSKILNIVSGQSDMVVSPSKVTATPSTVPTTPSIVSTTPSTVHTTSSTDPTTPSTVPATPSTVPATPSTVPVTPSTVPTTPNIVPATPSTVPGTPSTVSATPSTVLTTPSTVPTTPSRVHTTSSTDPTTPSTVPATPSTVPGTPSTVSATPSTVPTTPATSKTTIERRKLQKENQNIKISDRDLDQETTDPFIKSAQENNKQYRKAAAIEPVQKSNKQYSTVTAIKPIQESMNQFSTVTAMKPIQENMKQYSTVAAVETVQENNKQYSTVQRTRVEDGIEEKKEYRKGKSEMSWDKDKAEEGKVMDQKLNSSSSHPASLDLKPTDGNSQFQRMSTKKEKKPESQTQGIGGSKVYVSTSEPTGSNKYSHKLKYKGLNTEKMIIKNSPRTLMNLTQPQPGDTNMENKDKTDLSGIPEQDLTNIDADITSSTPLTPASQHVLPSDRLPHSSINRSKRSLRDRERFEIIKRRQFNRLQFNPGAREN